MKTFLKPFEEMPQIEELREHLKKEQTHLRGVGADRQSETASDLWHRL